jgi:lipopolysaccharide biosynthesis glycosyltransferase
MAPDGERSTRSNFRENPALTFAVGFCTDLMMETCLHVAVCSLLPHASAEIDFYFMLSGFDAKRRNLLRQSLEMGGKAYKATFVDEPNPDALLRLRPFHGHRTPYYRLFLPDSVPADRLLYLDSDIVSGNEVRRSNRQKLR